MKKTYPGHSNALVAYCIRAAIISIAMLGSAIFLSANARMITHHRNVFLNKVQEKQNSSPGIILYTKMAERSLDNYIVTSEAELFLKGTINKRPDFSKSGLL